jgi:hypothetical protein
MHLVETLDAGGEPLRDLVDKVIAGDEAAWQRFWAASERLLLAIAGSRGATGPLGADVDERREVAVRVMERIRSHGFRGLQTFARSWADDEPALRRWLARVARREAAGHARGHARYLGCSSPFGRWAMLSPIVADLEAPDADAGDLLDVALILRRAPRVLKRKQLDVLRLWMDGESHADIASALGLAGQAASKALLDAAIKRLKRDALRPPPRSRPGLGQAK